MRGIILLLIIFISGALLLGVSFKSLESISLRLPKLNFNELSFKRPLRTLVDKSTFQEKQTKTGFDQQEGEELNGEDTSLVKIPPAERMTTAEELFEAVNAYRQSHNLEILRLSETLCEIAQKRAAEVEASGDLEHSGFEKYTDDGQGFSLMAEILFYSPYPQSGTNIVEMGWDKSQTGHREELLNPNYTDGCGGIKGDYAVFIFGG